MGVGVGKCVLVSVCVSKLCVFIYKLPSRHILSQARKHGYLEVGEGIKRREENEDGKKRKQERKR